MFSIYYNKSRHPLDMHIDITPLYPLLEGSLVRFHTLLFSVYYFPPHNLYRVRLCNLCGCLSTVIACDLYLRPVRAWALGILGRSVIFCQIIAPAACIHLHLCHSEYRTLSLSDHRHTRRVHTTCLALHACARRSLLVFFFFSVFVVSFPLFVLP